MPKKRLCIMFLSQKMSSTSTKVYFLLFFCALITTSKANKSFGEHFAHGLSVIKQIQNRKGLSPVELRYDTIFSELKHAFADCDHLATILPAGDEVLQECFRLGLGTLDRFSFQLPLEWSRTINFINDSKLMNQNLTWTSLRAAPVVPIHC